jgi:hypothetical protein
MDKTPHFLESPENPNVDEKYEGMTANDLVRKHIPDATDKECHDILWNLTAFPFAGPEKTEEQIIEFAESDLNYNEYYQKIDEEIREELKKIREEDNNESR